MRSIRQLLAYGEKKGISFLELRFQRRDSILTEIENGKATTRSWSEQGVCARALSKGTWGFCSTNQLKKTSLVNIVSSAITLAKLMDDSSRKKVVLPRMKNKTTRRVKRSRSVNEPDLATITPLKEAEKSVRNVDHRIRASKISCATTFEKSIIGNSMGNHIEMEQQRILDKVTVTARQNTTQRTASMSMGACSASLSQYQGKLTEMAISTAEKVIRLLESKPSPEGHFDIVTSPLITGLFVHEIVGHSMEADSVIDKRSVFKDKIGKKVAPEFVTIVDDPTQDGLYGSFSFDDEGTPGRRKFLIRNGEVETFLHTVETAGKMNANPNGSGRAETYSSIPLPRMSNTFMLSGNWNDDELVKETKEGVYCSGEAIGRVNPVKGTFSIKVEEAFLLRDGENVRNLVGPTILGSIRHTIHDIDAVAKNVQSNHPSICEKQGQRVPVSYGGPLVRIRKMLIR